jgi:hypothetical protein
MLRALAGGAGGAAFQPSLKVALAVTDSATKLHIHRAIALNAEAVHGRLAELQQLGGFFSSQNIHRFVTSSFAVTKQLG